MADRMPSRIWKWLRATMVINDTTPPVCVRESLSLRISSEDKLIEQVRERIHRLREQVDQQYPEPRNGVKV